MKKILALLLILCCAVTLFACKDEPKDDPNQDDPQQEQPKEDEPKVDLVLPFITAIANTDPIEQTITVARDTLLGTLNGTYHIVYNDDGSSTITYSYEKFNEIKNGDEELKSTVTGTVNVAANGTYSGDLSGSVSEVAALQFNLADIKADCTVEGNVLSVNVAAAKTASVFGNEYPSNVSLVLTIAEETVASFALSYSDNGSDVRIACQYQ